MNRLKLLQSTTIGMVFGAVLINAPVARSQLAVIDASAATSWLQQLLTQGKQLVAESGILQAVNGINSVSAFINNGINDLNKAIGVNTQGDVQTLLIKGATQSANYSKAQISAMQQIQDASNAANARFQRDMRNVQIRDEHTTSPQACAALDGGVSTQSAAVQAYAVGQSIAHTHNRRGSAAPGMPSYYGQGQGVASMAAAHLATYCNENDAAAQLCTISDQSKIDVDQQFSSLFSSLSYPDQASINAAKDYATNLIQPVAPAALRGDQLSSVAGQDAAVRRRSYNARMSIAQSIVDNQIGMQTPSVPLTTLQQQYMTNLGLNPQTNGSWLQVLQTEAERRVSDITWHATLQNTPPASVQREIASELALSNYLLFQIFKTSLQHTTVSATQLAVDVEHSFVPTVRMPAPSIADSPAPASTAAAGTAG